MTEHIDLLRDSVRTVRRLYPFYIDAWVVLQDHMHSTARMQEVRHRHGRTADDRKVDLPWQSTNGRRCGADIHQYFAWLVMAVC